MKKFKQYKQILLFDFETTGLDFKNDSIIEFGGLLLKNIDGKFEVAETFDVLVKTDKPLDPKIIEITNITDEMLAKDGIKQRDLYEIFKPIYDNPSTLFIAYNLQFDISFLNELFVKFTLKDDFVFYRDVLDAMAVYKDFFGYPWKLDAAVESLKVEHKNTHRASDDCIAMWLVFQGLVKHYTGKRIDPYINTIGYMAKYGINGLRMGHVKYVAQRGGGREIINGK